jgi:ribonuclease R
LPEVKVDLDNKGTVTGAHEVPHDESHQIIEEFMLAANVAVATGLADRNLPLLRRVHGEPDVVKLRAFAEFAAALGYPIKQYQSRPHLQELLGRVRGEPTEHAINYALLRSMKQAEYSNLPLGHYALAFENYCHFTSPIRRYPDLVVHRILGSLFKDKHPKAADEVELAKLGKHCSFTERRAAEAERELIKTKLLTFMSERIGEELEAVITGVEQFGIFCQGVEIPVEGMVHISALDADDFFDYDAATFSLVGRRKGKQYRLGDRVRVSVAHVDVDRRQLDFRVVAVVSAGQGRKKKETVQAPHRSGSRDRRQNGRRDGKGSAPSQGRRGARGRSSPSTSRGKRGARRKKR